MAGTLTPRTSKPCKGNSCPCSTRDCRRCSKTWSKAAGRDHWGLCQSVLLAGGGIRGGQVHGSSDRIGAYPAADPVDPVDVHATVYQCMGLDPAQTINDHLGRPQPV